MLHINRTIGLAIFAVAALFLNACSGSSRNLYWAVGNIGQRVNGTRGSYGVDIDYVRVSETGRKTIVAIIDSGIAERPDLKNRLFINANEIPCDGIDNDDNGYADDYCGWDFSERCSIDCSSISSPHGTEVAHIIAGNVNGWTGVSTNALLLNIRTAGFDRGNQVCGGNGRRYCKFEFNVQ